VYSYSYSFVGADNAFEFIMQGRLNQEGTAGAAKLAFVLETTTCMRIGGR